MRKFITIVTEDRILQMRLEEIANLYNLNLWFVRNEDDLVEALTRNSAPLLIVDLHSSTATAVNAVDRARDLMSNVTIGVYNREPDSDSFPAALESDDIAVLTSRDELEKWILKTPLKPNRRVS